MANFTDLNTGKTVGRTSHFQLYLSVFAISYIFISLTILFSEEGMSVSTLFSTIVLSIYVLYLLNLIIVEYAKKELCSPVALFSLAGLLFFGIFGIFYYEEDFFYNSQNRKYYTEAIFLIFAYTIVFNWTFNFFRKLFPFSNRSVPERTTYDWSGGRVFGVICFLLMVGWFARIHLANNGVYLQMTIVNAIRNGAFLSDLGIWRFLEVFPDYAAWIAWVHFLRKIEVNNHNFQAFWKKISILLIIISILYWIPTGRKLLIVTSIITPLILLYLTVRKLPSLKIIITTAIFMMIMFPAMHAYRVTQESYLGSTNMAFGIDEIGNLISMGAMNLTETESIGAQGRTFGRLNEIEVVSGAIRVVEDDLAPLRFGQDYLNMLVNLIPRMIWPSKPYVFYGNEFGHLIGQVGFSDESTSIASTLIGEAYLNFRMFGVFVASLVAAIFYFLYKQEHFLRSPETGRLLYGLSVPTLLYIDASFALYFSSLIQQWFALFIICWFMRSRWI